MAFLYGLRCREIFPHTCSVTHRTLTCPPKATRSGCRTMVSLVRTKKTGPTKVAGKLLASLVPLAPRSAVVFSRARKFLRIFPVYHTRSRAHGGQHSLLRGATGAFANKFRQYKVDGCLLHRCRYFSVEKVRITRYSPFRLRRRFSNNHFCRLILHFCVHSRIYHPL